MNDTVVKNFHELHEALAAFKHDKRWVFRGQSDVRWPLLPKAGRHPYCEVGDEKLFRCWMRAAIEFVPTRPDNDWDWLAIAQHHGLATRLLDWTFNPLNAAFFATREVNDADATITAAKFRLQVPMGDGNPMEMSRIARFLPTRFVSRITRQSGCFSIQPNPKRQLEADDPDAVELRRLIIPAHYRNELLLELSYYGINEATLFPDLDGLSSFLNWTVRSREYWRKMVDGLPDVPMG
jgi:hypothetical protein